MSGGQVADVRTQEWHVNGADNAGDEADYWCILQRMRRLGENERRRDGGMP